MKIISDFSDYYDSALSSYDDNVVYQRKTIEYNIKQKFNRFLRSNEKYDTVNTLYNEIGLKYRRFLHNNSFLSDEYQTWYFTNYNSYVAADIVKSGIKYTFREYKFILLFCGKIYPGIRVTLVDKDNTITRLHFYNNESYINFLANCNLHLKTAKDHLMLKLFFSRSGSDVDTDFHITNKITNVLVDSEKIIINPRLADYEFYKVFDTYTCFQELEMWMAGTLSYPQNIMVEVSDQTKVEKHGFDKQYGFRTRPKHKRK